jgi:hypothetical protein
MAIALAGASCTAILGNDFAVVDGAGGSGGSAPSAGGGGMESHCDNSVRDEGETDVDCGGSCAAKCELRQGCMLDSDCASDNCGDEGVCVPPPPCNDACASWQTCEDEVCTPGVIFYVNLDGGTFSYGADDDASLSIQEVGSESLPSDFDPYGGTEFDKQAIVNPIAANFEPFNVEVTDVRPDAGTPYQMVVVTPTGSALEPGRKLFAPTPDCGDRDDNNVAFVIYSAESAASEGISPASQAIVASQAIGIMLGLEPVNGITDIMHEALPDGSPRTFENLCHAKPVSDNWLCNAQHRAGCNDNDDLQNSFAELTTLFGAAP